MVQHRRLIEKITDPAYAEALGSASIEQLRAMRGECREGEKELSFERRLCQARIDILTAELERRAGTDGEGLVQRLQRGEILGEGAPGEDRGDSALPDRAPDFSIPRNADVPRRRVEEIVGEQTLTRLPQLHAEEIKATIKSLAEHERQVSERRRLVHDVVDRLQAEIVRRYTSGEADPTSALD